MSKEFLMITITKESGRIRELIDSGMDSKRAFLEGYYIAWFKSNQYRIGVEYVKARQTFDTVPDFKTFCFNRWSAEKNSFIQIFLN